MRFAEPIKQVAYFSADAIAAARQHSRAFGSGPFFVFEHVPYTKNILRGEPRPFDHTTVIGQWGDVMVEFMQQHNSGPSICHDLYPEGSGLYGLHHVCLVVDDVAQCKRRLEEQGFPTVCEFHTALDITCFFADSVASYGHFIEYIPRAPLLVRVHQMVAAAAKDFDGKNLLRTLTAEMISG